MVLIILGLKVYQRCDGVQKTAMSIDPNGLKGPPKRPSCGSEFGIIKGPENILVWSESDSRSRHGSQSPEVLVAPGLVIIRPVLRASPK